MSPEKIVLPGTFYPLKPDEHFDGDLYMRGKQIIVTIDEETGQQVITVTENRYNQ